MLRWRVSELSPSLISRNSLKCKYNCQDNGCGETLSLQVIYMNEYLTECFFQNYNKVKTPETHSSRCIQDLSEAPLSVSTQWETLLFSLCFSDWLWVQNGSRVTGLLLTGPHTARGFDPFLISLDPLEREIKCHTLSHEKKGEKNSPNHPFSHVKSICCVANFCLIKDSSTLS